MIWSKRFPFCLCIHFVEENGSPQTHIFGQTYNLSFPIFKKHTHFNTPNLSTLFKSFQIYFFHLFSKPISHCQLGSKEREREREREREWERERTESFFSTQWVVKQQTMQWTKTAVVINSMNEWMWSDHWKRSSLTLDSQFCYHRFVYTLWLLGPEWT
jgi:hypothetical protein